MKKMNKKGFTLAELLIVVAIIAVLVAIAIPVFTSQLDKAKQATDAANIRSAYAEAVTAALSSTTGSGSATTVPMKSAEWGKIDVDYIGGTAISSIKKTVGSPITINVDTTTDPATITFG